MNIRKVKLGDVAPANPINKQLGDKDAIVWHLNLDQVESQSGNILKKIKAPMSEASSSTHWFDTRHVLYSKLRPYLNKVVLPDEAGVATTELVPMLPDPAKLDRKYLAYYLRSKSFVSWVSQQVAGAKMPRVSMKVFWDHEIPLPDLDEQQRIAAILEKADALCRKRQKAIELGDQFLQSAFMEMFGDPVSNPKGWGLIPFGEAGSLDRGRSKHRPRNDPALLGGAHPLIQTGDVANAEGYIRTYKATYSDLGLQQSRKWPAGTLCITIAANIAKTGILTFDACFPDSVVGFKPNELVTVEYVRYWLMFLQKSIEAKAPESAQKNINLQILRELTIPVPPKILQNQFSSLVEKGNDTLEKSRSARLHGEELFNALSKNAFEASGARR